MPGTSSIFRVILTEPSISLAITVPPMVATPCQTGTGVSAENDCVGFDTGRLGTRPVPLAENSSRPSAVNLISISDHWWPAYWRACVTA